MPYSDVSQNLIPAHALENIMFVAYCNRSGIENRTDVNDKKIEIDSYLGNSVIAGPMVILSCDLVTRKPY